MVISYFPQSVISVTNSIKGRHSFETDCRLACQEFTHHLWKRFKFFITDTKVVGEKRVDVRT